jgi:hypothetical protein
MSKTIKSSGNITLSANNTVFVETNLTVAGNLAINGTTTSVNTTNTNITDRVITLNKGEAGPGVSSPNPYSGIEIDRGTSTSATLRWNETLKIWEISDENGNFSQITTSAGGGGYLTAVVDDTSPELGANLDLNNKDIEGIGNINITGTVAATGNITGGNLQTAGSLVVGLGTANELEIYAQPVGLSGTGIWYTNAVETAELISKKKAIIYSIIF